jgi:hypothetical protein
VIFEPNRQEDGPPESPSLLASPGAWLPILMSGASLMLLVVHIARYGITHETDEGTSAHVFQLLMGGQALIIPVFALRWLPEKPGPAIGVIAMQCAAAVPPFALLYWFEHIARVAR